MQKENCKKSLKQSILSVIVISFFIFLAIGSWDEITQWGLPIKIRYEQNNDDKSWTEQINYLLVTKTTNGYRDDNKMWHGKVNIKVVGLYKDANYEEDATMANGVRQGLSTVKYDRGAAGFETREYNYLNGTCLEDRKSAELIDDISAFEVMGSHFPWYVYLLNVSDFDTSYIQSFMDTVEILLNNNEYDAAKFNSYYEDILNNLEETPYDSIITANSIYVITQGLEELKRSELRLAVIDRYRTEGSTTYKIIENTYPNYLHMLNDSGITNHDFEYFCHDLDDSLNSYGSLNPKDSYFLDSVDSRLFRALSAIINTEKASSLKTKISVNNIMELNRNTNLSDLYHIVNKQLNSFSSEASPSEVGSVVVNIMVNVQFIQGDIMRQAFREAWSINNGVIRIPKAATEFLSHNSATSVSLRGFAFDDGGGIITLQGIAWADFYNPTIDDNKETYGTTAEEFMITLNGLTEGKTYYARTFATNSAGTAYGNCVEFVANNATGTIGTDKFDQDLTVYPNPASGTVTLYFSLNSGDNATLRIYDLKGSVIVQKELTNLQPGPNLIKVNVSGFNNGIYICQITNESLIYVQTLINEH